MPRAHAAGPAGGVSPELGSEQIEHACSRFVLLDGSGKRVTWPASSTGSGRWAGGEKAASPRRRWRCQKGPETS